MKFLHAPWRWSFLSRPPCSHGECVFCNLLEKDDPDDLMIHRGKHLFVILNKYPYSTGHLMVVPYDHLALPDHLSADAAREMWSLLIQSRQTLARCFSPEGFNLGMNINDVAGAGVRNHVHMHVVPRWKGDANFMAIAANTRVVSYDIREVTAILRREWAA